MKIDKSETVQGRLSETEKGKHCSERLRRFLLRTVAVLTLLLGAALCIAALMLYFGGLERRAAAGSAMEPIFTREAVEGALLRISPLALLWFAAVISALCFLGTAPDSVRVPREKKPGAAGPMKTVTEGRSKRILRICLYAAAVILLVLGVLNGGLKDVLIKAINICTECIGLG